MKKQKERASTNDQVPKSSRASARTSGMEREFAPPPETWNDLLLARACVLAQPMEKEAESEFIEVVTFLLAYETYGIETSYVREVYPLKNLTPLPGTPAFVAGIVNVRGQVLSVVDIKKFFELPERGLTDLNKVIILSDGLMEFGILADSIVDVRRLPLAGMQATLPTLTGIRENYLKGIAADRMVILDAAKLLADSAIVVHEDVA